MQFVNDLLNMLHSMPTKAHCCIFLYILRDVISILYYTLDLYLEND